MTGMVLNIARGTGVAAAALLAGAGLVACSSSDGSGTPTIVVTHSLLGDVVEEVVGDEVEVEVIMPAGADPHEFEPSAAQVAAIAEADLVVANGLDFEQGLTDALDDAEEAGVPVLSLGEQLDPLPLDEHDHQDEHGHEDDHDHEGGLDPHWFTDPARTAAAATLVGDAVVEQVDGVDQAAVEDQAAGYAAELEALDAEVADLLADVPEDDRVLVTDHEVFGYFADRYGFEVVGTVFPGATTLAEPSSADLAELVEVIEQTGVPAIFTETSGSDELADTVAAEVGEQVEVVELYGESLGEPGSDGATYPALVRTNAERVHDALT